jgi:Cu/Ag efflux protein CusF
LFNGHFPGGMKLAYFNVRPVLWPVNERNDMKTIRTCTAATAALALLSLAPASPAWGADSCGTARNEKAFKGSVTAVDAPEQTLAVKGFLFTRNFNAGADCKVSLEDKSSAALADLRPGEQVDIRYQDDKGVLIARNITQHDLIYTGEITSIDPAVRRLTLKEGLINHNLAIAPNCTVNLKNGKAVMLANLQVGDIVRVKYESVNGEHTAVQIVQRSDEYLGTIEAVDASTRSIKVQSAHDEKKFNLADSCPIVVNGKLDGSLSDLRIGDRVSLSYDNNDGVLVANRVTPVNETLTEEPTAPAPSRTAKAGNQPPFYYGY